MTLAELAAIDLDDRAYCLVIAAARRSRPRVSPRVMLERLIAAIVAEPREVARLMCSRCSTMTAHAFTAEVAMDTPKGRHVSRLWTCGPCGERRQFGGGVMIDEESAA